MSRPQTPTEAPEPAPGLATEPAPTSATDQGETRLLRINEVASETGLTTRAIRYYEEVGLLAPAARSEGDYRLYDSSDLDRLQFIRSLRDDAGFSLAQIGQLLEDDAARERNRERFRQSGDPEERRALVLDARTRTEHQIEILEAKAARIGTMIEEARARARHLDAHLAELDGAPPPHEPGPDGTADADAKSDADATAEADSTAEVRPKARRS